MKHSYLFGKLVLALSFGGTVPIDAFQRDGLVVSPDRPE